MGVAYSQDLRERVMAAVDGGLSVDSAAPLFRVSVSYIDKALGRRRATGDVTAHKSGGGPKPKLAAYDEALRAQVAQKADITLVELQAWLANDPAVKVSVGALWARLRHLGLTLKKSRNAPPSRIVPTSWKLASNGGRSRANGDRTIWSLSTKPAHRPQ
jgi:transposase